MFGEGVRVLHCCIHVARNIQRNTGMKSDLLKLFWAMRYARTEASELAFIDALERLHAAKRSLFTTQLVASLDTFVPSRIRGALDTELFPELGELRRLDVTNIIPRHPDEDTSGSTSGDAPRRRRSPARRVVS